MKVQVSRAFSQNLPETFFRHLYEVFSTSNIVKKCLDPLFQNQRPHFLLLHLFRKKCQPSSHDQQIGKRTYCQLAPQSFWVNFKDAPSHIFMYSYVYLSKIFLEFFLKPVYRTMVVESFKFMILRLLENPFVSQKIESVHFYSYTQSKLYPVVVFLYFSPSRTEVVGLWNWKKWPKLTLRE